MQNVCLQHLKATVTQGHTIFFDTDEKVRGKDSDEHIAQPTGG